MAGRWFFASGVPVGWAAGPEGVLVERDALLLHGAKYHGADSAVANGQSGCPLGCGLVKPDQYIFGFGLECWR